MNKSFVQSVCHSQEKDFLFHVASEVVYCIMSRGATSNTRTCTPFESIFSTRVVRMKRTMCGFMGILYSSCLFTLGLVFAMNYKFFINIRIIFGTHFLYKGRNGSIVLPRSHDVALSQYKGNSCLHIFKKKQITICFAEKMYT